MLDILHYLMVILLHNVSYQGQANAAIVTCARDFVNFGEVDVLDTSNMSKAELVRECCGANSMSLEGETTFVAEGLDERSVFCLLSVEKMNMCILIENSTTERLFANLRSITGSCEGPKLTIVNNHFVKEMLFEKELFENVKSESHAIRIRGNKMISEGSLDRVKSQMVSNKSVDIQNVGECQLPKPFKSFQELDKDCTSFYGPLVLNQGVTEIAYKSSEIRNFELEGCVQIEKTGLKDLTFLHAFSRFKPIPSCPQFIRDNPQLCSSNLDYLDEIFEKVDIYNNSEETCSKCLGGKVSVRYLDKSSNCTSVYGDLIISNLRGIPSNIGNLGGIESIDGRLIIMNNTGLHEFGYLHSLRKVGLRNEQQVDIIVKDNADLKALKFPNLANITLKNDYKRIELTNNPMLDMGDERIEEEEGEEEGTSTVLTSSSRRAKNRRRKQTMNDGSTLSGSSQGALLGITFALFWFSHNSLGKFVCLERKKRRRTSLQLQSKWHSRSHEDHVSFCTENKNIS